MAPRTVKDLMPVSLDTILFCKRLACPSSPTLLAYRQSRLSYGESSHVSTHLETCDFCNAELQLLGRHREDREQDLLPEMPADLRVLAKRLKWQSQISLRSTFEFFHA